MLGMALFLFVGIYAVIRSLTDMSRISVSGDSKAAFHNDKNNFCRAEFPHFGAHSAAFTEILPRKPIFYFYFLQMFLFPIKNGIIWVYDQKV